MKGGYRRGMKTLIVVLALGGALLPQAAASAAEPGTCWNVRSAAAMPSGPTVDCDSRHTAELLGRVRGTRLTPAAAWQDCQARALRYVGQRPAGSYALPRSAQLSVYVSSNRRQALCVGFNTSVRGVVVGRTGSVRDAGLTPRVCLNKKSWKPQGCGLATSVPMTNVAWLSDSAGQRYPGNKRALRLAARQCLAVATAQGLVPEAWFVPGPAAWADGNHYAQCQFVAPTKTDTGWLPVS